jgi:hypothetical protein
VQTHLEEPNKPLRSWGKPFVYGLDSEADAHDYTDKDGYTTSHSCDRARVSY